MIQNEIFNVSRRWNYEFFVDTYGAESHMFAYIAKLLSDQDAGVTPSQV